MFWQRSIESIGEVTWIIDVVIVMARSRPIFRGWLVMRWLLLLLLLMMPIYMMLVVEVVPGIGKAWLMMNVIAV
jgi:hypothetical protein